ncbi:MAG: hypothetical protein E7105_12010 [Prevotella sp.]|nr:hypothetical protein [Prevotella sp.]
MKNKVIISRVLLAVLGVGVCLAVYLGINEYKAKQQEKIESAIKATNEFIEDTKSPSKPKSYEEAFNMLNHNNTSEEFAEFMRMKLVQEQSNNIPFEQTDFFRKWDSDYKKLFQYN